MLVKTLRIHAKSSITCVLVVEMPTEECIEWSDVMLLLLLLSPPACSSGVSSESPTADSFSHDSTIRIFFILR